MYLGQKCRRKRVAYIYAKKLFTEIIGALPIGAGRVDAE